MLAPAKVNLFLHVGPVEPDGYHPLASLVVFADVGDEVVARPAALSSFTAVGPYAADLGDPADNLIVKALRRLGEVAGIGPPPLKVTLEKRLPVAAGLGGGSSDAGAALKLARDLLSLDMDDPALARVAAEIGADGPMCLHAQTAWAQGRGERLEFVAAFPPLPAVLINPGVASPTAAVYRAYDAGRPASADRPGPPANWELESVLSWLSGLRNDLEDPAVKLQPAIATALTEADRLPGARLSRMSGSGATVFALFGTPDEAKAAARGLAAEHPSWWVRAATLS